MLREVSQWGILPAASEGIPSGSMTDSAFVSARSLSMETAMIVAPSLRRGQGRLAMLTLDDPGVTGNSLASHQHPHARTRLPTELTTQIGPVTGIDVRLLPAGAEVVVNTRNSRYRFVMLNDDGSEASVWGGRCVDQGAVVRIEGSCVGRGGPIKIGWINVGLFLEFRDAGATVVTSRVRSIFVLRCTQILERA